ncbi:MAG: mandelate racemase/muconate lactonizing enzyme family protein [Ignavibacteriae bacterium]|nr:MAG: mandelate racemase/muconate lactonizing enzyme family protein [Ignavibacteriota bacterium]
MRRFDWIRIGRIRGEEKMSINRREFIRTSFSAGLVGPGLLTSQISNAREKTDIDDNVLREAANAPVLHLESVTSPVIIESIELLKSGSFFLVRSRSKDGAVGLSMPNEKIKIIYPILLRQVIPFFIGKDARDLENLLDGVYVHESNYKMQGLPFWCCVACVELSILDLLGKTAKKHVSAFFGKRVREKVPIYVASGNRETTAEEEVKILQKRIAETGARAIKFKVGGRMSRNRDSMPNRSEDLIELSRKVLGDSITIQADSNGSFDVPRAIEIGKRLEAIQAYLFEEPCPFDDLDSTKKVADALSIPISGGEQESSEYRFKWMIRHGVVQIVQPDLHYYGGYVRATRVARMAASANIPITTHISSGYTGFADMINFFSFTPNMGKFQELKTGVEITGPLFDPPIKVKDGFLNIPTAPGLGMVHTKDLLERATTVQEHL